MMLPPAAHAYAQQTAQVARQSVQLTLIPDSTITRVIATYNRAGTTRFSGDSRLPSGSALTGDVASLNGTLEIGGRVGGDVLVINGDLNILSTAVIDGAVTVLGGTVHVEPGAVISKDITSYRELVRLRADGDQIAYAPVTEASELSAGHEFGFGRTDLLLAVRGSYNRVEGLPIAFGPRITLGSTTPTRLQALVTYRTATGFDVAVNQLGYLLSAEHFINSHVRADASVYREIAAIEEWDLSAREASLAAFVLHRDYRDHYDRRGWNAALHYALPGSPYDASITYRNETNKSVAARDPVALFNNGDTWRAEALVAEGTLHSLTAGITYDTRNDARDPADGWMIRASVEQALGGSLRTPASTGLVMEPFGDESADRFNSARFDIRRYARLTPYARVACRVIAAGSVDGGVLPAQRQLTLGGEGSLPAYPMAAFDCGADDAVPIARADGFQSFHGCDRMVLTQIEYQASFPFVRKIGEKLRLGSWLTNSVRWAAFFDAGRAWNEPASRNGRGGGRNDFSADTGLGVKLGPLGVYWAFPLSGSDHQYNFFMRLGPRL
jgi:hypothetical protein